jgi:hypothetical protein
MKACEELSRGVDLPFSKQPEARTEFQLQTREYIYSITNKDILSVSLYSIDGIILFSQTESGYQVNLITFTRYYPFSHEWSHPIIYWDPILVWTPYGQDSRQEAMSWFIPNSALLPPDVSYREWITPSGSIPNPYSCEEMYILLPCRVSYNVGSDEMSNYISPNPLRIDLK